MRPLLILLIVCCLFNFCAAQKSTTSKQQDSGGFMDNKQKHEGFFDFYWDSESGKIWLEIPRFNEEFLYVNSLAAGIGSNDIGLDRGQLGSERVVKFIRSGPKVLLVQVNYKYRAVSDNVAEKTSVEQAFAQSVLGGFKVVHQDQNSVFVDITDFLLRDAHDVIGTLRRTKQGVYQLDTDRSAVYLERTKNFTDNTEFESTLTFALKANEDYGEWVASVVPTAESITVRQHHSFIRLPDDGYQMRVMDPRSGFFGLSFHDYATPIDQPLVKHFIQRHRLEKKDPEALVSEAIEPIVYYLDPGAPEPIRSALMEGAGWWNQAFEAIGYKNAFQIKVLPEDADPMDVRYNVIQWVHRSTRGWSYGSTVSDPRTGEIIKGHVSLGSLRVRQDFLIAQGLLQPYRQDQPPSPLMLEMALARLRQLSAHEVGHTLGLQHNFAASTDGRASVMDYPHPFIQLDPQGELDFSDAYDDKIGAWDQRTILYGYQDFPDSLDEQEALAQIILDNIRLGLKYITDRDARPMGGTHPQAHLWDNGSDAVEELVRLTAVRKKALSQFGENNLPGGSAWSTLEEVLVPLYLAHRYQMEAVAKLIGGMDYSYAHRGDGQPILSVVDPDQQKKAIQAMMNTLDPEFLHVPESIRKLIPPKPPNYQRNRESFKSRTGITFDPLAAAEGAAAASIGLILNSHRASRLVQQKAMDANQPGLEEVIDQVLDKTWQAIPVNSYQQQLLDLTAQTALQFLMQLAIDESASVQVRAITSLKLSELQQRIQQQLARTQDYQQKAQFQYGLDLIKRFKENPKSISGQAPVAMPDGSPIGWDLQCGYEGLR